MEVLLKKKNCDRWREGGEERRGEGEESVDIGKEGCTEVATSWKPPIQSQTSNPKKI